VDSENVGPAHQLFGGSDTLRGNENKPLRAGSNRNTNERRKRVKTLESMVYEFLIATKLHVSEEKAKSEEKTNLQASQTIVLGMHKQAHFSPREVAFRLIGQITGGADGTRTRDLLRDRQAF
jgi:hypothetical protein